MTERSMFRRAIALAGTLGLCGCATSGAALRDMGSAAWVARFDADRDGGLDRAEVTGMVAAMVPGKGAARDALRAGLAAGYWTRDCNRDGRLDPAELATDAPCA